MSLRSRIFVIVSLVVFGVLGIALLILVLRRGSGATTASQTPAIPAGVAPGAGTLAGSFGAAEAPASALPGGVPVRALSVAEQEELLARQASKVFIERYYSYSRDGGVDNIREVETLVTPALWGRLEKRLATPTQGAWVGATTRVLGTTAAGLTDTAVTVAVHAQRTLTRAGGERLVTWERYQVKLQKTSAGWRVDQFALQP